MLSLILLGMLNVAEDRPAAYPKAELLIEPAALLKSATPVKYHILDARSKEKYAAGHIPGAVWVNHDHWAKGHAENMDEAAWERTIGELGIAAETPVVIYDDMRFNRAARIWWILRTAGVHDVRLLNGGWKGWQDAGGTADKETPKVEAVKMKVMLQKDRVATKDSVKEAVKHSQGQIIDTRSKEEYVGEDKRAKRGGAIPGAKHLEWSDAIDAKTQRFKSADELKKLFASAEIDPSKPCTTYCQSGGRAAVMAFTLELMGGKDVRNYYRSWAEWGDADDTPIEKPKK
jgi:thiosulfate/3-mercaptopyruvate sulfurtransferase